MRFSWILVLVALNCLAPRSSWAANDGPPNIVVVVTDDHRADVLGCADHDIVRTPNLDHLASQGVRFTEAYVTTAICAASRASILTGLVERTHRFTFGTPPLATSLCDLSYPTRLRKAGYHTGFVGKLGISVEGGQTTLDSMFDDIVQLTRTPYIKTLEDGRERHVTDLTGDHAIEFIKRAPTGQPFCLSISFNAPHAEDSDHAAHYPPPTTEASLYADIPMPRPRLDDDAVFDGLPEYLKTSLNRVRYFWRWDTPEKYDRNLRNYFRMLTGVDRNIGRVLATLQSRGLASNTIVIVLGDNGYYMGERGLAGKWSHFDEAIRVPCIVSDPRAHDRHGDIDDRLVLNIDIAPTVLAAAGVSVADAIQGRPLPAIDEIDAEEASRREQFFCEHRMRHRQLPRWEGVRTTTHKYARYLDATTTDEHLYDLVADPDELNNLARKREHRAVLRRLRAETERLSAEARDAGGPLPRVLILGDSISMGYHRFVAAELDNAAVVVRPGENCEGTTKGLLKLEQWLIDAGPDIDVVHFNFGLHDLKRVQANGRNSNDPADDRQAELEQYEANLRSIVLRLQETEARLIYATTTPVPTGGVRPHRDPEDVERYNDIARRIMAEHSIPVNDLYEFSMPRLDRIQNRADVHFSREGSRLLGLEVAHVLRKALAEAEAD